MDLETDAVQMMPRRERLPRDSGGPIPDRSSPQRPRKKNSYLREPLHSLAWRLVDKALIILYIQFVLK